MMETFVHIINIYIFEYDQRLCLKYDMNSNILNGMLKINHIITSMSSWILFKFILKSNFKWIIFWTMLFILPARFHNTSSPVVVLICINILYKQCIYTYTRLRVLWVNPEIWALHDLPLAQISKSKNPVNSCQTWFKLKRLIRKTI